jgi:hypothetical protein
MEEELTVAQLERRWINALTATNTAVSRHPAVYRELKYLLSRTIDNPIDIKEYLPTTEKIVSLLTNLDPNGKGSIFYFFNDHFFPSDVRQVSQLRLECRDLLDHLKVFDEWRRKVCRLEVVK